MKKGQIRFQRQYIVGVGTQFVSTCNKLLILATNKSRSRELQEQHYKTRSQIELNCNSQAFVMLNFGAMGKFRPFQICITQDAMKKQLL